MDDQLLEWDAHIIRSELSRDRDGHVCCDLTLKMQRDISLEDINDFILHNQGIISAEGSPVT